MLSTFHLANTCKHIHRKMYSLKMSLTIQSENSQQKNNRTMPFLVK